MKKCKEKAEHLGLPMKVVGVDFQSGGEKVTFFLLRRPGSISANWLNN